MDLDDRVTWAWSAGAAAVLAGLAWVTTGDVAFVDRALLAGSLFGVWTLALGLAARAREALPAGAWARDGPGALNWQDVLVLLLAVAVYPTQALAGGLAVSLSLFVLGLTIASFAVGASFVLDAVGRPPVPRPDAEAAATADAGRDAADAEAATESA